MRTISNIFLLPLLALFGFGFLLSHSLNLTLELKETRDEVARLQMELRTLEGQYQAVIEEKNRLNEQISGLTSENHNLHNQVETLEAERQALANQIITLQGKMAFIEKAHPILAWLASSWTGRLSALLMPFVPISLGAAYVMNLRRTTTSLSPMKKGCGPAQAIIHGVLTREEFHYIAQRRRLQQIQDQSE